MCVFHLPSDGSESIYLTICIGQGDCMQACQDLTVGVRRRHGRWHHISHCSYYSDGEQAQERMGA